MGDKIVIQEDDFAYFIAGFGAVFNIVDAIDKSSIHNVSFTTPNGVRSLADQFGIHFDYEDVPLHSFDELSSVAFRSGVMANVLYNSASAIFGVDRLDVFPLVAGLYDAQDGFQLADVQHIANLGIDALSLIATFFTLLTPIPGDEVIAAGITLSRLKDFVQAANYLKYPLNFITKGDHSAEATASLVANLLLNQVFKANVKDPAVARLTIYLGDKTNSDRLFTLLQEAGVLAGNDAAGTSATSIHGKILKFIDVAKEESGIEISYDNAKKLLESYGNILNQAANIDPNSFSDSDLLKVVSSGGIGGHLHKVPAPVDYSSDTADVDRALAWLDSNKSKIEIIPSGTVSGLDGGYHPVDMQIGGVEITFKGDHDYIPQNVKDKFGWQADLDGDGRINTADNDVDGDGINNDVDLDPFRK